MSSDAPAVVPSGTKSARTVVFAFQTCSGESFSDGTALARLQLAGRLAERGVPVTIVSVAPDEGKDQQFLRNWCEVSAGTGKMLCFEAVSDSCPQFASRHSHRLLALQFCFWLKQFVRKNPTASVFVGDDGGFGYYAFLSKALGLDFADIRFVQELHSLSRLVLDNSQLLEGGGDFLDEMNVQYMERRSLELADCVAATNSDSLEWCARRNWLLARDARVIPPSFSTSRGGESGGHADPVFPARLVFIAPQTARGGIPLVCDALTQLLKSGEIPGMELIFLGPVDRVGVRSSAAYLESRSRSWPWKITSEPVFTSETLRNLCARPNTVVIFPAGPSVALLPFLQCLEEGAAFLSAHGSALTDVLPASAIPVHSFDLRSRRSWRFEFGNAMRSRPLPDARILAESLRRACLEGVPRYRSLEPVLDVREPLWVDLLAGERASAPAVAPGTGRQPLVTVCIVTRNRVKMLRQALNSIEAQDYPNVEVIVVDDGSHQEDQVAFLDELETKFQAKGWRIERQEHSHHGVARNRAATLASGEFLLFMDDDNYALPEELSTFVRAALTSGADILTCGRIFFDTFDPPDLSAAQKRIWMPLGSHPLLSLFQNCVGDMNFFVKRDVFHALKGFRPDVGALGADREFLITAGLSGHRIEVVPEFLYFYREHASSFTRSITSPDCHLRNQRILRPFLESMPEGLKDLPFVAQNLFVKNTLLTRSLEGRDLQIQKLKKEIRAMNKPHAPPQNFADRLHSYAKWVARLGKSAVKRRRELARWIGEKGGNGRETPADD